MNGSLLVDCAAILPNVSFRRCGKHSWLLTPEGKPLADVVLRLRKKENLEAHTNEAISREKESLVEDVELALHSAVLTSCSIHFRHRLLSLHGETSISNSAPQTKSWVLEEMLKTEEVSAATKVVKFLYTDYLQPDSPSELVGMLKIADRWKTEDGVHACRAAFHALKPEDIDLKVIQGVYSLEDEASDSSLFPEVLAATKSRVVDLYHDLVQAIRDPLLQSQLQQLPLRALIDLLRSDTLVVDSENSVVVAANLWVTWGQGRQATHTQLAELAQCINLSALTPSYLCGVLPNLKWFPPPSSTSYYHEVQLRLVSPEARQLLQSSSPPQAALTPSSHRTPCSTPQAPAHNTVGSKAHNKCATSPGAPMSSDGSRGGKSEHTSTCNGGGEVGNGSSLCAKGLFQGPQRRVTQDQNLELVCDIDYDRLSQYVRDGAASVCSHPGGFKGIHVHSECHYFCGFMWGIKVVFGFSSGAGGSQAAPFIVTPSVFASAPPGKEGLLPLTTPITVSFKCSLEAVGPHEKAYSTAKFTGASFLKPGDESVSSIGISNFFNKVSKQSDPEAWKPFLFQGKLRLRLNVIGASVE